jgi:hypothetical protein
MATRLLGAKLPLLPAREVLNARDSELSVGGGLLLRCSGPRAAWVFRYTSATGTRRETGLGACMRHNARVVGEGLALARELAAKQRALLASDLPLDPIDERDKVDAAWRGAERQRKARRGRPKRPSPALHYVPLNPDRGGKRTRIRPERCRGARAVAGSGTLPCAGPAGRGGSALSLTAATNPPGP